jgi:hypothetical protein
VQSEEIRLHLEDAHQRVICRWRRCSNSCRPRD